jgi:glycosyltransferase involved in cell wall biosynthesis
MNIKISILVPVYKVEAYLPRCIESVLSQDFTDYELILVDDGSPDKSGKICEEYASRYPEVIKVIHKKNGGLPSARLAGFQQASGKYIMFLDSDDYLLTDALSLLYHKIEEGYDMVRGGFKMVSKQKEIVFPPKKATSFEGNTKYRKDLIFGNIDGFLWGALYKKEVFTENVFKPIIGLSIGEDWCTNFIVADKIQKIFFIKDIIYAYWMNDSSIMHQTLASHKYVEKMHEPVKEAVKNDAYLTSLLNAHRMAAHINLGFHHEIMYEDRYRVELNKYIEYNGQETISKMLCKRYYLAFRHSSILYRIFNFIIGQIMKYKKYKGVSRKVIS